MRRLNDLPKYVVSTTLERLEWKNSFLVQGEVFDETQLAYGAVALARAGDVVRETGSDRIP